MIEVGSVAPRYLLLTSKYVAAEEHAEIKVLSRQLERTVIGSPDWQLCVVETATIFLAHAREEENVQFPLLTSKLTSEENTVCKDSIKPLIVH